MTILESITIALTAGYGALMLVYRAGWGMQGADGAEGPAEQRATSESGPSATPFSIVIPARNEAANIGGLLDDIFQQEYSADRYEVIVVDDHSTDDTTAIARTHARPNLTVLQLADYTAPGEAINSAKKRALALGIAHARHPFIITTDADCRLPSQWLQHLSAAFADGAVLAAAPVDFTKGRGLLYLFQSLDFMAMQGITSAAHALRLGTMSNGANLAFARADFNEVGGYTGIDHLASGDDYLLTRKLTLHFGHQRVEYVLRKGAVVRTEAQPGWRAFIQQRIRWASKSGKYNDPRLTAILVLVYAVNVWLLVLAVVSPFRESTFKILLIALAVKTLLELIFLWPVADFFGKRRELIAFPFLQPLHILYVVVAGFLGMRGNYEWKGRQVR